MSKKNINNSNSQSLITEITNSVIKVFSFTISLNAKDGSQLKVYDKQTGVWKNDLQEIRSFINGFQPQPTGDDVQQVFKNLKEYAIENQLIFKPYTGSNYLLFTNGVLDLENEFLFPLSGPLTKHLHFSENSKINVYFRLKPVNLGSVESEENISIYTTAVLFFSGSYEPGATYGKIRREYFLFLLSLGLLPNQSTGLQINLRSNSMTYLSVWKKLFEQIYASPFVQPESENNLSPIFSDYYGNNLQNSNLSRNNNILWIQNTDNKEMRLTTTGKEYYSKQFHTGNNSCSDPSDTNYKSPQIFIGGRKFINLDGDKDALDHTLFFDIPNRSVPSGYQTDESQLLSKFGKEVLVSKMIHAFWEFVPSEKRANFHLNLNNYEDLSLLPRFAIDLQTRFS